MNTNYPNGRLANEFQERAHQARSYCAVRLQYKITGISGKDRYGESQES